MLFVVCLTVLAGFINGCQQPDNLPECQKCTLDQIQTVKTAISKDFTSDKIYNDGPCAVRISLCNNGSSDTIVTYNLDGTADYAFDDGVGLINVTMFCSEDKKWMRTTRYGRTIAVEFIDCSYD